MNTRKLIIDDWNLKISPKKILAIVGPTATGKTKRAIEESKRQPSILISADSRQVYRGMDIVTGKDHPHNVTIYGVDIVDPAEPCSVSVWYEAVMPRITEAWGEGKQVIVVGGTGLYIKALTDGIDTIQIPINQTLRDTLAPLSIPELQTKLISLDAAKFATMNHSDSLNPRRLIRAIEIYKDPFFVKRRTDLKADDTNIIGLKYSDESIQRNKIKDRVISRLNNGAIEEVKTLLVKYNPSLQSMSAIGYASIIKFIQGTLSREEMIDEWVSHELAYAKRQMTWFRKQPVIWYDIDIINSPTSP